MSVTTLIPHEHNFPFNFIAEESCFGHNSHTAVSATSNLMGDTELSKVCCHYCRMLHLPKELVLPTSTAKVLEVNLEILKRRHCKVGFR